MGAAVPAHDVVAGEQGAERHPRGDALGQGDDVGLQPEVLAGEEPPRAPHPALHLVRDQQDAVLAGDGAQARQEAGVRHHVAAFALHRLDDHRRDLAGIGGGREHGLGQQVQALDVAGLGVAVDRDSGSSTRSGCGAPRAGGARSRAAGPACSRSGSTRRRCDRGRRRRKRRSSGGRCANARASPPPPPPPPPSWRRRPARAPAPAPAGPVLRPAPPRSRRRSRWRTCGGIAPTAPGSPPPRRDGNGRSPPRRSPPRNRGTDCRPRPAPRPRARCRPPAGSPCGSSATSPARRVR